MKQILHMSSMTPLIQRLPKPYYLRLVIALMLVLGVVIVAVVGVNTAHSLVRATKGQDAIPATHMTTLAIQRTAPYAGLNITVVNAQEAASFSDDAIHAGRVMVRLNFHIADNSPHPVSVVYYDVACLLVPGIKASTPTNMRLATEMLPGKSQDGWLDFSLPKTVPLNKITLQLGSFAVR